MSKNAEIADWLRSATAAAAGLTDACGTEETKSCAVLEFWIGESGSRYIERLVSRFTLEPMESLSNAGRLFTAIDLSYNER